MPNDKIFGKLKNTVQVGIFNFLSAKTCSPSFMDLQFVSNFTGFDGKMGTIISSLE